MTRSQPYPIKAKSNSHKSAVLTAATRNTSAAANIKSATAARSRVVDKLEPQISLQMPEKISKPVVSADLR